MLKRVKTIFVALAIIVSAVCCTHTLAGAEDFDGFYNEDEVFDAWGEFTDKENEDYAGMYIDGNGVLNLLFVSGSESYENARNHVSRSNGVLVSRDGYQRQNVIIKGEKYSYSTLLTVMNYMVNNAYSNSAVKTISVDVKNNAIDFGIETGTDENEIRTFLLGLLAASGIKNTGADIMELHEETEVFELAASINELSQIKNAASGTAVNASVGVGFYRSNGDRGFITCGHGFSLNDNIYCGTTKVGTITKRAFNGTCDASFVLFDPEDNYTSLSNTYEELSWSVPIVGATVKQRGYVSGILSNCSVLSNTFSYTSGIYTWTNLIKTNTAMQSGDSGGGLHCGYQDLGKTAKIVGILSATSSTYALYIRGQVVSNALS